MTDNQHSLDELNASMACMRRLKALCELRALKAREQELLAILQEHQPSNPESSSDPCPSSATTTSP